MDWSRLLSTTRVKGLFGQISSIPIAGRRTVGYTKRGKSGVELGVADFQAPCESSVQTYPKLDRKLVNA